MSDSGDQLLQALAELSVAKFRVARAAEVLVDMITVHTDSENLLVSDVVRTDIGTAIRNLQTAADRLAKVVGEK